VAKRTKPGKRAASTAKKSPANRKTASARTKSSGPSADRIAKLSARFLGTKKKPSRPRATPRADSASAEPTQLDAEAIVLRSMPGVEIVHPTPSNSLNASQAATVHGASLPQLMKKYAPSRGAALADSATASAKPVRSRVVHIQQKNDQADVSGTPKVIIVRDGKISGCQG